MSEAQRILKLAGEARLSLSDEPLQTIERALAIRDQKSRYLMLALLLCVAGFGLYCVAVAQLLLASR